MRKYGQHFLTNIMLAREIVAAARQFLPAELVEIGPGKGALTGLLIEAGEKDFSVVEIDPEMVAVLNETLPPQAGVRIVNENFLTIDLSGLVQKPTVFISNLPYIDAADILDKTLSFPFFKAAVFMFQKEQAARILAQPGADAYGPLSILSQSRALVVKLFNVGRGSFTPPPKVESSVLLFERLERPLFNDVETYKIFALLVKAAFAHKRKTMFNSLLLAGYSEETLRKAYKEAGIDVSVRAEKVNIAEFLQLNQFLLL